MTPQAMSALHHAAFTGARGWSAEEFADLLASPHVTAITAPHGIALIRTVARESELLTLAVEPAHQRKGIAKTLMQDWLKSLTTCADRAFLEVAADNQGARALYASRGFQLIATRAAYYSRSNGSDVDALILSREVTAG